MGNCEKSMHYERKLQAAARRDGKEEGKEGGSGVGSEREGRRDDGRVEGSAATGSVVREIQAEKESIVAHDSIVTAKVNESYSCKLISNYGNPCDHPSCRE